MKKIILISGKAESGKNQFADYLQQHLESNGQKVVQMAFAYYIKDYMKRFYNWDGVTKDEEFRTQAQLIGTDIIREKMNMPNFHVNRICEDIKIIESDVDYVIISDVRFFNEIYYTQACFPKNTLTVRVLRPNHVSKLTKEQLNHRSEVELDGFEFDEVIHNGMDLEHLDWNAERLTRERLCE